MTPFDEQSIFKRVASWRRFILGTAITLSAITWVPLTTPLDANPSDFTAFPLPEPSTTILMLTAFCCLALIRRRTNG